MRPLAHGVPSFAPPDPPSSPGKRLEALEVRSAALPPGGAAPAVTRRAWLVALLAVLAAATLAPARSRASAGSTGGSDPSAADTTPDESPRRVRGQRRLLIRKLVDGAKGPIAVAGALLLWWGSALGQAGRPRARRRLRDGLLVALGILGGLGWWNFLTFHQGTFIHAWDSFHYYVGAKYFAELGYERLYLCVAVADAEDGHWRPGEERYVRDLGTNTLRRLPAILASPAACTRHFTAERWEAFKHDVAWFRSRIGPARWGEALRDHGYNGTPVWAILGTWLASAAPASPAQMSLLAALDGILLLVMWGFVVWAFGWRTASVAMIYWGTNFAAGFYWTGGGYLRQDWLVASVVAICLLRRGHPGSAGFLVGWAALLRVFPVLLAAGLALQALDGIWRERRLHLTPETRRFALGMIAAVAVLVPLSLLVAGGGQAWTGFLDNSRKHWNTPLTNYMGLKTVVAYEHATRAEITALQEPLEVDPFAVWKEARRRVFAERWPLFAAAVVAFVLLLALAVRGQPGWAATVLAVGLVPVVTELTCYYYSILLAYAFLAKRRASVGAALCGLAAVSWLVPGLLPNYDELYAVLSAAVLAFVLLATVPVARHGRGLPGAPEPTPAAP